MSEESARPIPTQPLLVRIQQELGQHLWEVEAAYDRELEARHRFIVEVLEHLSHYRGKRSRVRAGPRSVRRPRRRRVLAVTSSIASSKASRSAAEGALSPLTLRTYCKAAARTSSSVVGGSKW